MDYFPNRKKNKNNNKKKKIQLTFSLEIISMPSTGKQICHAFIINYFPANKSKMET
jgi:hypothetical protein